MHCMALVALVSDSIENQAIAYNNAKIPREQACSLGIFLYILILMVT